VKGGTTTRGVLKGDKSVETIELAADEGNTVRARKLTAIKAERVHLEKGEREGEVAVKKVRKRGRSSRDEIRVR